MGNASRIIIQGPCKSCNANGGLWFGEPDSVRCMRPMQSSRHAIRGDAARHHNSCWRPVTQPLPLEDVMQLVKRR